MKNIITLLAILFLASCKDTTPATPPPPSASQLLDVMQKSAADWNKGDLTGFMDSYDDSATMMSSHGLIGKDSMMAHYKETYFKDGAPRQQLSFDAFHIQPLAGDYVLLV